MEKKIIVLGAIGKTERKNRDAFRVLSGGVMYALPAHIKSDQPLVTKKWKRNSK